MKVIETGFAGLLMVEPNVLADGRGHFFESFNKLTFQKAGINLEFVQDNQSRSKRGSLRGLHYQKSAHAQTKLVSVLSGLIQDVVVDMRKGEPTFGKHFSIELSSENKAQLLVPKGFAHGFLVLSEWAEVFYKCDDYYHPESEGGIIYNDPTLGIDWKFAEGAILLSDKDQKNPSWRSVSPFF